MNFFLLSHHRDAHLSRAWNLGGLRVCARCLGLYPTLALGLWVQHHLGAPALWEHDFLFVIGLTAPGLWDWARGVEAPESGTNALRTFTGVLLGAALARSVHVHLQNPLPWILLLQLGVIAVVALRVHLRRRASESP